MLALVVTLPVTSHLLISIPISLVERHSRLCPPIVSVSEPENPPHTAAYSRRRYRPSHTSCRPANRFQVAPWGATIPPDTPNPTHSFFFFNYPAPPRIPPFSPPRPFPA